MVSLAIHTIYLSSVKPGWYWSFFSVRKPGPGGGRKISPGPVIAFACRPRNPKPSARWLHTAHQT